jgi:hypothetical protein
MLREEFEIRNEIGKCAASGKLGMINAPSSSVLLF